MFSNEDGFEGAIPGNYPYTKYYFTATRTESCFLWWIVWTRIWRIREL